MSRPFRAWWFEQALRAEGEPSPTPLAGDRACEVCIVGGGYTGLWTAILIKQEHPQADVVVIEQDLCGYGASGSNGGCMLTLSTKFLSLAQFYGEAEARRLVRASEDAVHEIADFAHRHDIKCDLRVDGAVYMATNAAQVGSMNAVLAALDRASSNAWERLTPEQASAMAGTPVHEGFRSAHAGSVQPALLVRGLARVAREMGVRIFERTPMQRLEPGAKAGVVTPRGRITANKVVLALNAWMPTFFPEFTRSITVVSSDMGITEPCGDALERIGLSHGASVCDARTFVHYYHSTPDGRLLLGKGGNRFAYGSRMIPAFFQPSTYEWQVRGAIDRFFPHLRGVKLESCWNGGSDRSTTGFPFFGRLRRSPNVFYGFGYSGNGVTQSLLGAKILRSLVLGMDDAWSRCGFVGGPRGQFPPEPIRWVGAHVVRNAIRRKESAEDRGRRPVAVDVWLSHFARGAGKADKRESRVS